MSCCDQSSHDRRPTPFVALNKGRQALMLHRASGLHSLSAPPDIICRRLFASRLSYYLVEAYYGWNWRGRTAVVYMLRCPYCCMSIWAKMAERKLHCCWSNVPTIMNHILQDIVSHSDALYLVVVVQFLMPKHRRPSLALPRFQLRVTGRCGRTWLDCPATRDHLRRQREQETACPPQMHPSSSPGRRKHSPTCRSLPRPRKTLAPLPKSRMAGPRPTWFIRPSRL